MNGYDLTRNWYNFKFENPDLCKHIHSDLYFYIVDLWNRFGQKDKFGLPTSMTMESLGIKSRNTYYSAIKDLQDWKFIKEISPSKNQNTSRVISICACVKKLQALDQATIQANDQAISQTLVHIDKQKNKETKEQQFILFWSKYPSKTGKKPAKEKFMKLSDLDIEKILLTVGAFSTYKPFKDYTHPHATTYLNQRRWEDEIPTEKPETNLPPITRDVWHIAKQIPAQMEKICAKYNLTEDQFKSLF